MPVIQARPEIAGTTASMPPTVVRPAIRPTSRVPITLSLTNSSPSSIRPRAASTASRAEVAVPVAQRSSRPGATTVALRASPPSRGAAVKTTNDRTPSAGSAGWAIFSCSATAGRMRSPSSASSRASPGTISNPSASASTNAQNAPP